MTNKKFKRLVAFWLLSYGDSPVYTDSTPPEWVEVFYYTFECPRFEWRHDSDGCDRLYFKSGELLLDYDGLSCCYRLTEAAAEVLK